MPIDPICNAGMQGLLLDSFSCDRGALWACLSRGTPLEAMVREPCPTGCPALGSTCVCSSIFATSGGRVAAPSQGIEGLALPIDEADLLAEFLEPGEVDSRVVCLQADEEASGLQPTLTTKDANENDQVDSAGKRDTGRLVQGAPGILEALLDPCQSIESLNDSSHKPNTTTHARPMPTCSDSASSPCSQAAPLPPSCAVAPVACPNEVGANGCPQDANTDVSVGPLFRFVDAVIAVAQSYLDARTTKLARDLLEGKTPPAELEPVAEAALARAKMVEPGPDGLRPCPSFLSARNAWGSLLQGDPADFSGCEDKTLDQWAAELIAALAGRSDVPSIQRALRKRKVAAFGMLDN